MQSSFRFVVGIVVGAIGVLSCGRAEAGFATASLRMNGVNDSFVGGTSATVQGSWSDPRGNGDFQEGFATATGESDVSRVFVFGSSAVSNYNNPTVLPEIITEAFWQDRLILGGAPGVALPNYVELHFHSFGRIDLSGSDVLGGITVTGGGSGTAFNSTYSYSQTGAGVTDGMSVLGVGWDRVTYGAGRFEGDWHIRIVLDSPDVNGDRAGNWSVGYYTNLLARRFSAGQINGGDPPTLSFTAVRLADGRTPEEAGMTLRFASGILSPNSGDTIATPEPSSLTLLGTGLFCLLGWRRRQRSNAPAREPEAPPSLPV